MKTPVELAREALQDPGAVVCFVLRVPLRSPVPQEVRELIIDELGRIADGNGDICGRCREPLLDPFSSRWIVRPRVGRGGVDKGAGLSSDP